MNRPPFSEMLVERRRALGLSVKQASRVIKLKEEVLIAFEEGDFENIPKSGFAQGMLSSYARYLGLNPNDVIRRYTADLRAYNHSVAMGGTDVQSRSAFSAADTGGFQTPVRKRSHLRGGSGTTGQLRPYAQPTTDVDSFSTTTSYAHVRGEHSPVRYTSASSPLVGSRQPQSSYARYDDEQPQARRYSTRDWSAEEGDHDRQRQRRRTRSSSVDSDARYEARSQRPTRTRDGRDRVTTRSVRKDQYQDDLRMDGTARQYQAASTSMGRRSSRNIASTERPNVRRQSRNSSQKGRGRRQQPRRTGLAGIVDWFGEDSRRTMALIAAVVAILLIWIIVSSVSSCVNDTVGEKTTVAVTEDVGSATSVPTGSTTTTGTTSSDEDDEADAEDTDENATGEDGETSDSEAADEDEDDEAEATPTSYQVTVSVEDGEVSWVEIQNGGDSVLAKTVTGPWSETYTVSSSITVQVADSSVVTVTCDGETVHFDERPSGVGTLTIEVPESDTSSSDEEDADAEATDEETTEDTEATEG